MVREFHKVIGEEAHDQILQAESRLPDYLFACVGGGSNAIGLFHAFLGDKSVKMVGVEAGGRGKGLGEHAARLAAAAGFRGRGLECCREPILICCKIATGRFLRLIPFLQGWIIRALGRSTPGLLNEGRAEYTAVSDDEAVAAARTAF